jgi:hypothetical protein
LIRSIRPKRTPVPGLRSLVRHLRDELVLKDLVVSFALTDPRFQ